MQAKTLGVLVASVTMVGLSSAWAQEAEAPKPAPGASSAAPASSAPGSSASASPADAPVAPAPEKDCVAKGGEWLSGACSMDKANCQRAGNTWDSKARTCETKKTCPEGTVLEGTACVAVPVQCQPNEKLVEGRCVANPPVESPTNAPAEPLARPKTTLGLEGTVALSGRLGSPTSGYEIDERAGFMWGAGLFFAPSRKLSVGLGYTRAQGGSETYGDHNALNSAKISRTFHTAALQARIYPVRSETVGLYAGLLLGAAFQTASVSGSLYTNQLQPRSFDADSDSSAGLALGAGLGFDYDISDDLAFLSSLNFTNYRFSSDPLKGMGDHPVAGVGATSVLDFRASFQYRFDLSGTKSTKTAMHSSF